MKPTLPAAPVWVIGIGNTLRRDDGAGWLLAQALAATLEEAGCPVHLTLQPQLLPELAAEATELQPAQVIFVDASTAVSSPHFTPLSPGRVGTRVQVGIPPPLWVFGVDGRRVLGF